MPVILSTRRFLNSQRGDSWSISRMPFSLSFVFGVDSDGDAGDLRGKNMSKHNLSVSLDILSHASPPRKDGIVFPGEDGLF